MCGCPISSQLLPLPGLRPWTQSCPSQNNWGMCIVDDHINSLFNWRHVSRHVIYFNWVVHKVSPRTGSEVNGDSNHCVSLEHVIDYHTDSTFWCWISTGLVTNIIRKPYPASVRIREIASWSRLQLIGLLYGDDCISLKELIHVPLPSKWSILDM